MVECLTQSRYSQLQGFGATRRHESGFEPASFRFKSQAQLRPIWRSSRQLNLFKIINTTPYIDISSGNVVGQKITLVVVINSSTLSLNKKWLIREVAETSLAIFQLQQNLPTPRQLQIASCFREAARSPEFGSNTPRSSRSLTGHHDDGASRQFEYYHYSSSAYARDRRDQRGLQRACRWGH